ncbi:MAG: phytanoyl-CoA dioxygenase [Rhodospirillaceae bacterium]|nr:phytanoyl-CoA dioxygenase [Rhodospirillaceae bacterium]|tara:strand:- start:33263 stop:34084 length:822 start_codon:yes stop_codon:yes gene_type:complete
MPKLLTDEQVDRYHTQGAIAPIKVIEAEEADDFRRKFEDLEQEIGCEAQSKFRIKAHLPFPWLTKLTRNSKILDAIEDLIGPDIVVWGSSFFTKKANDHRFVSWHQDSTYYGFDPAESITAWVAFSDSTRETGCVRIIPGSHEGDAVMKHVETFDPDNLLARGQTIEGVDENEVVDLELRAGEMSVHHNKTVHSSMPNPSNMPRIGYAIHICAPHVRQTQFEGATGTLVRGEDNFGHWAPDIEAKEHMDPECLAALDVAWERYRTSMKAPYEQ